MRSRKSGVESRRGRLVRAGFSGWLALVLACAALAMAGAGSAHAEDDPGVARVSLIEGNASYLRGDADDWTGVSVNAPLVTGDRFYSAADSRAEIQLDPAVYARISSETEVSMLELGPETTQVRMSLGLATFRVRRDPGQRHVEIDTPGAAIVVREAGAYRVSVDRSGDTNLQVRDGEATIYVAGEQYQIGDGRGAAIEGIGDAARPRIYAVSGSDGWDEWESQRAGRLENAVSTQYVSEGIYGAEDLDEHGDWEYQEPYGNVWRPRVAAEWAPYTDGRWVWVDPWGWTWMDYSSWGWAPFHYGRWVYANNYWGWAPGPIIASPVYAPALVGWFGGGWGGVSVSVGVGFGSIGWTPLGWGEPCFPWWGGWGGVVVGRPWWGGWGGPRYFNNVVINKNITNINVNNYNFGNLRHRGGFSSVPVGDFQNGRGRISPVGSQGRADFRAIGGRVPVVPTRDSLPATNPSRGFGGRTVQPPSDVDGRRVVSARTPTTSGQPSFERKLPVLERNQGAPLTPTTLREMGRDGGRAPLVQNVANPDTSGRQVRTLPATSARGDGDTAGAGAGQRTAPLGNGGNGGTVARRGDLDGAGGGSLDRAGADRAGSGRQTLTLPGARTLPSDGAVSPRTAAVDGSSGRSIARPPTGVERGGAMPVAPRTGSGARQPYVARRPDFNGSPGSASTGGAGSSGSVPRSDFGRSGGAAPPTTGREGAAPRTYGSAGGSNPVSRSVNPGTSAPQTRALPGGSSAREVQSAPRTTQPAPRAYPPAVQSAPAPDRGGSSRNYFSQPRTVAPPSSRGNSAPRSYANPSTRTAPAYRGSTPQTYAGRAPMGNGRTPQVRSAPAPQVRAPRVSSAPAQRSGAPAVRSMPSAPSGGGYSGQRSAPSGMSRGFSSGAPGGAMSRSGGGMSGGSIGGGRSFGGGGRSGG